MAKKFSLPYKYELHLHYLLFYHLFFSLFFTWYILNFGGDSKGYWGMVMEQVLIKGEITWFSYFGTSTTFILWLCYMPSKILGLSYLTGNILFGFLGFIGIRYLFVLVATKFPVNHYVLNLPLFPLIFYIPNLHFWSSGVGKDSISFWAIAWFLFAIQEYKSRWWQAGIALFFAYYTRPHIGQALIGAIAIALVLGSEIKISYKIFLGALALIGTSYLSSTTLDFLEISDFSLDEMTGKAEKTAFLLKSGNVKSGVDISSYPWPLRIFTYMFRPLFLDAHNVMALLSSFENALYLYLSFFIYRNWTPEALRDMPVFLKTGIIMFIPITLAFANSLGNLGVIMRMKNMTMIYFLLFCFFLIAYNKKLRYQKLQEKLKYYKQREEVISKKREMELKKG
ncbi:hypothetical protein [Fontibacter flavus]|uniref:Uncharacterized protein n=1 Tax=Fontibacter flavus TaxID=654838 RepID=A0ABV6FUE9_9BACT